MTSDKSTYLGNRSENTSDGSSCCLLSEAYKIMPGNVEYISLRIRGMDVRVSSANDVLLWVCKKMLLYRPTQFNNVVRHRKTNWLRSHCGGMSNPCCLAYNCYVDMDGRDTTLLFRAAKILEWLAWSKADASLRYRSVISKSIVSSVLNEPTLIKKVEIVPKKEEKPYVQKNEQEKSRFNTLSEIVNLSKVEKEIKIPFSGVSLEKLFSKVSAANLAWFVIMEILKHGMDSRETWHNLMSMSWCRQNLGLRNALVRELRKWERAGEYAQTYSILNNTSYNKFLILKWPDGLRVTAFINWAQGLGLRLEDICKLFGIELSQEKIAAPGKGVEEKVVVLDKMVQKLAPVSIPKIESDQDIDEQDKTVYDYIEKHLGCTKQKAIEDLKEKGINKVSTRLERQLKIIEIGNRLYIKDLIEDLDGAATILQVALDSLFAMNGGYTSAHELFQAVQLKLDDFFFNNDAFESEREIFDIAAYLFGKVGYGNRHYIFQNKMHIWREEPDYPMEDCGLLIHWARLNGGVLTRQIGCDNLERRGAPASRVTSIFTSALKAGRDKFWVLEDDNFLLKEGIVISAELLSDIKHFLDELLAIEEREDGISFIPFGVIGDDFLASLPPFPCNRTWTILLFQSIIIDYSEKLGYKTIARSNHMKQVHAAIVPNKSEYEDFSDLVYAIVKARNEKPFISYERSQFIQFLKLTGLYPEDMTGASIENLFNNNCHFKWQDKNNLVVS